jgi:CRP-like cAMP-binding protein
MRLHEGDFFGEIALLSGKQRQATVKACGKVAVLVIGRDAFTRLCGNLVTILQRSMSNYSCVEITAEVVEGTGLAAMAEPFPTETHSRSHPSHSRRFGRRV